MDDVPEIDWSWWFLSDRDTALWRCACGAERMTRAAVRAVLCLHDAERMARVDGEEVGRDAT